MVTWHPGILYFRCFYTGMTLYLSGTGSIGCRGARRPVPRATSPKAAESRCCCKQGPGAATGDYLCSAQTSYSPTGLSTTDPAQTCSHVSQTSQEPAHVTWHSILLAFCLRTSSWFFFSKLTLVDSVLSATPPDLQPCPLKNGTLYQAPAPV